MGVVAPFIAIAMILLATYFCYEMPIKDNEKRSTEKALRHNVAAEVIHECGYKATYFRKYDGEWYTDSFLKCLEKEGYIIVPKEKE